MSKGNTRKQTDGANVGYTPKTTGEVLEMLIQKNVRDKPSVAGKRQASSLASAPLNLTTVDANILLSTSFWPGKYVESKMLASIVVKFNGTEASEDACRCNMNSMLDSVRQASEQKLTNVINAGSKTSCLGERCCLLLQNRRHRPTRHPKFEILLTHAVLNTGPTAQRCKLTMTRR